MTEYESNGLEDHVDELRKRVIAERERLGRMSIREAAAAGGLSRTTWGKFESGEIGVTTLVNRGVARAFDWPDDWATNVPEIPVSTLAQIDRRLDDLARSVESLVTVVERLVELAESGA